MTPIPPENVTTHSVAGMTFYIRTEKSGDENVIGEVVSADCYGLHRLKAAGFEPKTILDVGAHIGTFSALAHDLWPDAVIYAFEPNPRSFELLGLNAPFAIRCKAAVRYDGAHLLTDGEGATGGGFVTTQEEFAVAAATKAQQDTFIYSVFVEDIRTFTLEEIFDLFGIREVDLLKLDCEGSEMDCLKNMSSSVAQKVHLVLGEYHTQGGFPVFQQLAENAFPHLWFYGGNGREIGPFWSRPRSLLETVPLLSHSYPAPVMETASYPARIFAPGRGDFKSLRDSNVLIYFPHGFGDWVQFSFIAPLLHSSNTYWMTRFGDDNISVMEGHSSLRPLYLGSNSVHSGNGDSYENRHFGIDMKGVDGSVQMLHLPPSVTEAMGDQHIDAVLCECFPEVVGKIAFPYHTKARHMIPYFVDTGEVGKVDLRSPLTGTINFQVASEIQRWVETRLRNFTGWGPRKLCLISRNGYTSIGKNWGHMFREDLPSGRQVEGQECRDFMRLMLKKDSRWTFLIMEDRLFEGEHSMRDPYLHAYSFAELFGTPETTTMPFGWVMKALLNCADLSIGVPTGPYHLSMAKADLPTIGLWIEHLPSWYDEPKEASIHIISRHIRDIGLDTRLGSFFEKEKLKFKEMPVETRIITGEQVLNAVETLFN